jgi:hypothetical protein
VSMLLGLLGLPSIGSIVEGIVNFFFQDVARALVPNFLKNASVSTIKWLVAVPDPSSWTHIGRLEGNMLYLAVSLLSVSFTAAVVRYLVVGLSGSGHPLQALASTFVSAGLLVAYPWAASQMVAMINTLTNAVLSFPIVGEGLRQTVGIMFGGALLVGSGGVFLALLVIVGVVLGAIMFALKVFLLLAFALLYVTGPLVIAVRPLPELAHLSRAWGTALLGISLVPVGWTILFAVAGALSLDATSFGAVGKTGVVGALPTHIAGVFAALLTFFLAVKLPFGVLGRVRGMLGGVGGGGHSQSASGDGGFQRVADANAHLRTRTLQAGRAVGLAAGALGAPAGGAVGAAARAAGRFSGPLAFGASLAGGMAGARIGDAGSRLARSKAGQAVAGSSRAQGLRERFARAGRVLSDGPHQPHDDAHSTDNNAKLAGERTGADVRAGAGEDRGSSGKSGGDEGARGTGRTGREGGASSRAPQPKQREQSAGASASPRSAPPAKPDARQAGPGDAARPRASRDSSGGKQTSRSNEGPAAAGGKEREAVSAPGANPRRPPTPTSGQGNSSSGSASKRGPESSGKPKRVGETPGGVSSTGAQQGKPSRPAGGSARPSKQPAGTDAASPRAPRQSPRRDGGSTSRPRAAGGGSARAPRARVSGPTSRSGGSRRSSRQASRPESNEPGRFGWFRFKRANGRG